MLLTQSWKHAAVCVSALVQRDLSSLERNTPPEKTVREKYEDRSLDIFLAAVHALYSLLPTLCCQKLQIHFMDITALLFHTQEKNAAELQNRREVT